MKAHNFIDVGGQIFGYLTVVGQCPSQGDGRVRWFCKCVCGAQVIRTTTILRRGVRRGDNQSCGCKRTLGRPKHSGSKTREYRVWAQMIQRCTNPNNAHFKEYGARGITVCERWLKFENFLSDMGSRPDDGHTLERSDNNKGYSPKNCVWATRKTQLSNTRRNVYVMVNGEKVHVTEAARRLGLNPVTVSGRLNRSGWSVERAFDYRAQAVAQ